MTGWTPAPDIGPNLAQVAIQLFLLLSATVVSFRGRRRARRRQEGLNTTD